MKTLREFLNETRRPKTVAEDFRNELGNDIRLAVTVTPRNVQIVMEGPKSTMDNTITTMEARKLIALLTKALEQLT